MIASECPQHQDELMAAIRKLVDWYCSSDWATKENINASRGRVFFELLQKEAFGHLDLLLGEIPNAAQR
jgi:hypothetical protein